MSALLLGCPNTACKLLRWHRMQSTIQVLSPCFSGWETGVWDGCCGFQSALYPDTPEVLLRVGKMSLLVPASPQGIYTPDRKEKGQDKGRTQFCSQWMQSTEGGREVFSWRCRPLSLQWRFPPAVILDGRDSPCLSKLIDLMQMQMYIC